MVMPHNLIWVFDDDILSSEKVGDVGRPGSLFKPVRTGFALGHRGAWKTPKLRLAHHVHCLYSQLVFGIELGCGTPQILIFE
ncbi:hypothetical protein TorRG33x02_168260 [Trema orientale]|uniref:Uncharacterized protein n=1 Tax=Trema orientale TaxID=63057 RepID=A0A2P5EP68_TREOI|nr:hypothetical protein TorRG33x02_168260 [Trema orientale]